MPAAMPPWARTYSSLTSMTIRFFGLVLRGNTPMTLIFKGRYLRAGEHRLRVSRHSGLYLRERMTGSVGTNFCGFSAALAPAQSAKARASAAAMAVNLFILWNLISVTVFCRFSGSAGRRLSTRRCYRRERPGRCLSRSPSGGPFTSWKGWSVYERIWLPHAIDLFSPWMLSSCSCRSRIMRSKRLGTQDLHRGRAVHVLRALRLAGYYIPVGMCVMRTAESVMLTYWPPAPHERKVSILRSSGRISICTLSGRTGTTSTEAKLVWRRFAESKGDMRTRRWTPCSPLR